MVLCMPALMRCKHKSHARHDQVSVKIRFRTIPFQVKVKVELKIKVRSVEGPHASIHNCPSGVTVG
jgi:hypothetical protein